MTASPDNYFIGKGIVSWKATGEAEYRDLGNVPQFELTPAIEKLDHFSSRTGVRAKDKSIVIEKSLEIRVVMEEFTLANLAMAMLGTVEDDSTGSVLSIFTESEITGAIRLNGTNDVGQRFIVDLPNVSFIPAGTLGFITDEWGQIELTGDVLVGEGGSFGTITPIDEEEPEPTA